MLHLTGTLTATVANTEQLAIVTSHVAAALDEPSSAVVGYSSEDLTVTIEVDLPLPMPAPLED